MAAKPRFLSFLSFDIEYFHCDLHKKYGANNLSTPNNLLIRGEIISYYGENNDNDSAILNISIPSVIILLSRLFEESNMTSPK